MVDPWTEAGYLPLHGRWIGRGPKGDIVRTRAWRVPNEDGVDRPKPDLLDGIDRKVDA